MGGSAKGGGGGATSYDYFGTVAGAICWGPLHTLQAIIVDGVEIVTGPVELDASSVDLTLNPEAETYLDTGGRITIYRGDQTVSDSSLTDHPPYTGLAYLVAVGLLFGRERGTAPNVQVIASRLPQADTSLVPSIYNTFSEVDGLGLPTVASGVNPVAVLVEVLTGRHGLGLPVGALDASSWSAAAAWAADSSRKAYTFCSPSWTAQLDARQAISEMLTMIDATLFWSASGALGIALLKPGVTPASPITIDARHLTSRHRLDSPGLASVATEVVVRYTDRDAQWKQRDQVASNLVVLGLRSGTRQPLTIDRPHVTGASQAARHAAEAVVRSAYPIGELRLSVRRPIAEGMRPGDKILVDVDPEPGGSGIAQLCVVERVSVPEEGAVDLVVRPDTMTDAVPYSPAWTAAEPQGNACPPIEEAKAAVVPLPASLWPTPSVAVLATRPRVDVVGFRVYYSPDDVDYADLGSQSGFAVRATLGAAIDTDDGTAILTLTDGDSGPDSYLAERYPTTDAGALADELLILFANLDGSGRVVITEGEPEIEICSIKSRALVGSDMVYTLLRARQGTFAREWATTCKAWIFPASSLVAWTHPGIRGMITTGAAGYVHLVAYTAEDVDETSPIPERTFLMPSSADPRPVITWTTPSGSAGTTDSAGLYTPDFSVSDLQGDLTEIGLHSVGPSGNRVDWGSWRVAPSREWDYPGDQLQFIGTGVHQLVVTAKDLTGAVSSSVVSIERIAISGGDSLPAPRFAPKSGGRFYNSLAVGISINSPGTLAEWQLSPPGSTGPRSFGPSEVMPSGWTRVAGIVSTSFSVTLRASGRLWVRSGDGTNWGAWVFADFTRV